MSPEEKAKIIAESLKESMGDVHDLLTTIATQHGPHRADCSALICETVRIQVAFTMLCLTFLKKGPDEYRPIGEAMLATNLAKAQELTNDLIGHFGAAIFDPKEEPRAIDWAKLTNEATCRVAKSASDTANKIAKMGGGNAPR